LKSKKQSGYFFFFFYLFAKEFSIILCREESAENGEIDWLAFLLDNVAIWATPGTGIMVIKMCKFPKIS